MHYLELIKLQLEHKFCICSCKCCLLQLLFICSSISKLISQLIKDISRVLQILLRYVNSTIIATFLVPLLSVAPVIFSLYLNDLLLWLAPVKSTTLLCHYYLKIFRLYSIAVTFQVDFNNYCYILSNYTLLYSIKLYYKGAQFLNAIFILVLFAV